MQRVGDTIANVRIGEPMAHGNLTVFPLFGSHAVAADYITLDEALAQKCAMVTEVSEGGNVPELKFVNSGAKPIFLLDGEQLIGAKQNRVLNLSILVAVGKIIIIPVTCVEAGRWSHRSRYFSSSPSAHYAAGRAMKMAQVSASMRSTGERRSDQHRVWQDISAKSANFGVASDTSAMSDIFDKESESLKDYVASFSALEGQSGAVFAIDGQIVGLDLFDSAETLKKLFPKLLHSYGLDAIDNARLKSSKKEARCATADVEAFLNNVREAKEEEFPAVGEGVDIRLSGRKMTGAALLAEDHIVHLSAFATAR